MREESSRFKSGDQSLPPDEELPEDDLDKLFINGLPRLEPPAELIENILSTISQLPASPAPGDEEADIFPPDDLIVRNEKRPPC